jgi:hypothetical protein
MNMDYNSLTPAELNQLTPDRLNNLRKTLNRVQQKDLYKKLDRDRLENLQDEMLRETQELKLALYDLGVRPEQLDEAKKKMLDLVETEKSLEDIDDIKE